MIKSRLETDLLGDKRIPENMYYGINTIRGFENFNISNLTFTLPKGRILGVIGKNGAGKTTLIKLLLNMITTDSGTITIFNKSNTIPSVKQQIGISLDSTPFLPYWSADTIKNALSKFYYNWDYLVFNELLQRFNINRLQPIYQLSRGTQLKLMIAFAISHDAKLLVFDEPTSGLDIFARREFIEIIQDFVTDGNRSVLFTTHIIADVKEAADFFACYTPEADAAKDVEVNSVLLRRLIEGPGY